MFKVRMEITPDCEIPAHVYNEAAELFLNHLEKFVEEQLLKGENLSAFYESPLPRCISYIRGDGINPIGKYSPALYKNSRGVRNVILTPEFQKRNTQLQTRLRKAGFSNLH